MNKIKNTIQLIFTLHIFLYFFSCSSYLKDAKIYYIQANHFDENFNTEQALKYHKKALEKLEKEIRKNPSSQAFVLKGLIELNLEKWEDAKGSFLIAKDFGFEEGGKWAKEVSLAGVGITLEKMGIQDATISIWANLYRKSKIGKIKELASQKMVDMELSLILEIDEKERQKNLNELLKNVKSLIIEDPSNSYFHYLLSQISSHLDDWKTSYEEAIMAKELGLRTEKIRRDNDLQIIFSYKNLIKSSEGNEKEKLNRVYMQWIKRWKWKDGETPDWKER
ncbi:MAG: hypothetical protein AB1410_06785 [Acidobacteriota bacterium]